MENLPYVQVAGTLEKMLEKIKTASVPDNFSQDFVSTKLAMKGGTARSMIPFIKRMGLVGTDGTPTERYVEYRNPDKSGKAIADAMRDVYSKLFEMNETVYELDSTKLKSLMVEATGAEPTSAALKKTLATFTMLKKHADFETKETNSPAEEIETEIVPGLHLQSRQQQPLPQSSGESINLSYTINLNLPATQDVEVFNAIFKSLKQHLLQG